MLASKSDAGASMYITRHTEPLNHTVRAIELQRKSYFVQPETSLPRQHTQDSSILQTISTVAWLYVAVQPWNTGALTQSHTVLNVRKLGNG